MTLRIMMGRLISAIFGIMGYISLECSGISFAADEPCNKDRKQWDPVSAGPAITWSAPVCGKGKLVVQPYFFYNRTRGAFNDEGHYKSFKNKDTKSQYQELLLVTYGLTDRLEINGQGVYQQNLRHVDGNSAEAAGFGDSYLYIHYCAVDEKGWLPHITGMFQLKFPTGKYEKADEGKLGIDLMGADSGGGSYEHGYGINITKKIKPFILHVDAVYNFPIETKVDGVKTRYGSYINYDFAVEYFLPKGLNLILEINIFSQGDKKADGSLVPASDVRYVNMTSGISWSCKEIQTLLGYQRTLAGTNTDVKDSLIVTFIYTF